MDIFKKRRLYFVIGIMLCISIFSLTYYISAVRIKKNSNDDGKLQVSNVDKNNNLNVQGEKKKKLKDDGSIVLKTKYTKSGDLLIDRSEKLKDISDLKEKTKEEIESKFNKDGYSIESFDSDRAVLIREIDKYSPNKYVLGIKGEYLAIYKTDKFGNMFIEDEETDITKRKIDHLKEQDIQLLTKGDKYFQCNTKEEAMARLEDYE
ncbi:hypothetical protein [Clostridium tetani]|uniref:Bypass of forespore C C-terminal domain-containing protein n=1 Tax=Clostridium tetani TaxID=1513 RepID=A0ABY0ESK0_CLOTA|nr:hypothetical protein [Clostridium tetani]CDI50382.1 hypothetical protein BN906_02398 [Clostridium tetani 12124569]KHO33732.1 hypothetical protein OR62_11630 [Clostridium tetani]RXI39202.1 hypothetical protein DP129_07530 [Clostridium tetani]RXI56721.1 hypothetical protein DP131_06705 [Clostridium tetani]RXI65912.1 hypothetical protein DQN76_14255 [Clostridium tetani]